MTDEEKKEYEELKSLLYTGTLSQYGKRKLIEIIEKQSKEIEEMKKQLDLDNECEIALNSKIMDLEKEIEELKEQCKEVVCIPEGTCFMLEQKNVDKKWKDKIKAKIEEVDYKMIAHQDVREAVKQVLQSLLEKE